MLPRASEISTGWRVRSNSKSPRVTGRVSRYSKQENVMSSPAVAPKLQRQASSAKPRDGRRNMARKPSRVGEREVMEDAASPHHDVDQLAGNDDLFYDLLSGDGSFYLRIRQRSVADYLFRGPRRYNHYASQLAVDLHRDFNLIFFCQHRIIFRPGRFEQTFPLAERLPQFVCEVRRKRSQQQNEVSFDLRQILRRNVAC